MAVEKITLAALELKPIQSQDSNTAQSANSFNNKFINPFEKPSFAPATPAQTHAASNGKTSLFGNNIVKDEETSFEDKTQQTELASSSKDNLAAVSKFFHHKKSQFKNFLNNIGNNVNEYDAAVSGALKYLPSEGELSEIVATDKAQGGNIAKILNEVGVDVNLNYANLKTIKNTHISTTVQFARAIGKDLGMNETELQTMEVGAALHDIGKSLIPAEILNKQGGLDKKEREIINTHSTLGYEILKYAGFGTNVAEIARDHHNPNSKNKMAQIVRAADVYSAMTEKRSYKEAKSHDEAMSVLNKMNLSSDILLALDNKYGKKQAPTSATQLQPSVA